MQKCGFEFQPVLSNPESPSDSWQSYDTHIGDINGDQKPDIIWNFLGTKNRSYFALNTGGNQFEFSGLSEAPQGGWGIYKLRLGDINADGADEFVWNTTSSGVNRTYISKLKADGSGIEQINSQDMSGGGWGPYEFFLGNVNGGGEDLIFNELLTYNHTYVALSEGNGTFTLRPRSRHPVPGGSSGWGIYNAYTAFADNNTNTDFILNHPSQTQNYIYVNLSNSDGSFTYMPLQSHPLKQDWRDYRTFIGDVDGDGIDDIVWTNQGSGQTISHVFTALGTQTGEYDFSPVKQTNPYQTTWAQYSVQLIDINGDSRKDMIWLKPGANTEIYTALSK